MSESNLGILEAIEIAMESEKNAMEFYLDAMKSVSDEAGINLLKQLADFEQNHFDILTKLKESLEKENKFIEYAGTSFAEFKAPTISKKIEPKKDDVLKILTIAIDAEETANKHYKKMAEQTSDTRGKEMFLKLAGEELMHRRILSDEFYQLSNKGGSWFWGD